MHKTLFDKKKYLRKNDDSMAKVFRQFRLNLCIHNRLYYEKERR